MKARDYQNECVAAAAKCLQTARSTLIVLPTGMGKTIVMGMLAGMASKRVLVVAHREELVVQNADKIGRYTGKPVDIEMGERLAMEGIYVRAPIVSASKDSLHPNRIARFNPFEFSLVLADEAHHATAKTYTRVFDHFRGCKLIGVTATPDRADEEALGKVFESVAYEMSIRDGIERGWLVPVRQRKIACESLDFSGVRKVGADFNQGQLAELLEQEGPLHEMTVPTLEVACGVERNTIDTLLASDPGTAPERFRAAVKDRKRTLIFCARVHHAELVTHILNRWLPGSAAIVHGKTPPDERSRLFRQFGAGAIQFLANVGIATEGWDDPATDGRGVQMVALMRPTQSRSLYSQMIGRGTRPLPGLVDPFEDAVSRVAAIAASPKPSVLILDFHDLADTHSLIHAEDVLGGSFEDKVVEKAKSKAKKGGGEEEETDVLEELVTADQDIAKAEEDERRSRIRAGVRYSEQDVDPFAAVGRRPRRVPGWFANRPASEKQIKLLGRFGLWNPRVVTNMGIASQLIDALAQNGWKRPKGVAV